MYRVQAVLVVLMFLYVVRQLQVITTNLIEIKSKIDRPLTFG